MKCEKCLPRCKTLLFTIILLCVTPLYAEWITLPPLREDTIGGTLGSIESRMPRGHIYRDSDKVTWGHETTHGMNSRIRNKYNTPNAFYCLNDQAYIIKSPPLTLGQIARQVPRNWRGGIYSLYMVQQQRGWNNDPLYVIEEFVAYFNGAVVGLECGMQARAQESYAYALEMYGYVLVMQRLSKQTNFVHQQELDEFITFLYKQRILWLADLLKEKGWLTRQHQTLLERYD